MAAYLVIEQNDGCRMTVTRFIGHQGVLADDCFTVYAVTDRLNASEDSIQKVARLTLDSPDTITLFVGIIMMVTGPILLGTRFRFKFELVSPLRLLKNDYRYRVWRRVSALSLLKAMLEYLPVAITLKIMVSRTLADLPYLSQNGQSSYQLLYHLISSAGLFLRLDCVENNWTLLVTDNVELIKCGDEVMEIDQRFEQSHCQTVGCRQLSFARLDDQAAPLTQNSSLSSVVGECLYLSEPGHRQLLVKQVMQQLINQQSVEHCQRHCLTYDVSVQPGQDFQFVDEDGRYVSLKVEHDYDSTKAEPYHNHVMCCRLDKVIDPRPIGLDVQHMGLAWVVDTGQGSGLDDAGRYTLQLAVDDSKQNISDIELVHQSMGNGFGLHLPFKPGALVVYVTDCQGVIRILGGLSINQGDGLVTASNHWQSRLVTTSGLEWLVDDRRGEQGFFTHNQHNYLRLMAKEAPGIYLAAAQDAHIIASHLHWQNDQHLQYRASERLVFATDQLHISAEKGCHQLDQVEWQAKGNVQINVTEDYVCSISGKANWQIAGSYMIKSSQITWHFKQGDSQLHSTKALYGGERCESIEFRVGLASLSISAAGITFSGTVINLLSQD